MPTAIPTPLSHVEPTNFLAQCQNQNTGEKEMLSPLSPVFDTPLPLVGDLFSLETSTLQDQDEGNFFEIFDFCFLIRINIIGKNNSIVVDDTFVLENSLKLEEFSCEKESCGLKCLSSTFVRSCLIHHLGIFKQNKKFYDQVYTKKILPSSC